MLHIELPYSLAMPRRWRRPMPPQPTAAYLTRSAIVLFSFALPRRADHRADVDGLVRPRRLDRREHHRGAPHVILQRRLGRRAAVEPVEELPHHGRVSLQRRLQQRHLLGAEPAAAAETVDPHEPAAPARTRARLG